VYDANNSGAFDAGDTPLTGRAAVLTPASGQGSPITASEGSETDLPAGTYTVFATGPRYLPGEEGKPGAICRGWRTSYIAGAALSATVEQPAPGLGFTVDLPAADAASPATEIVLGLSDKGQKGTQFEDVQILCPADGQSASQQAVTIDAIVIVDGKLAPPGTVVDIAAGSEACGSGVTVPRDLPMTVGSVLRLPLSSTNAACGPGASFVARAGGLEGAVPPPDANGVVGKALVIGRPVALIEGTAEQTGAVQSAPEVQLVVGTGSSQRICARAPVVPPVPSAPADAKPAFAELLLDPASGCAQLGDRVDLYVGDTFAETIVAAPGLTRVALKINRVVRSVEGGVGLPATGSGNAEDTHESSGRVWLLILAALFATASAGWLTRMAVIRRRPS